MLKQSLEIRHGDGTVEKIALDEKNPVHRRVAFEIEKASAEKHNPTLKYFFQSPIAEITAL